MLLQSYTLDEIELRIQYLFGRMAVENLQDQRNDTLYQQRIRVTLEI